MSVDADLLLPAGTRLVHIGPHKTGSTAVQVAFHDAREQLAAHGVHYAGSGRRPRLAGWSIGLAGKKYGVERPPVRHWDDLVAEVAAAGDQRVCISNEDFGRATREQRQRIVDDLGGERVHVVAVARRLDSYLPSQWQERVKAGVTLSWEDWLRIVLDRDADQRHYERMNVWRAHDVGRLLRNWTEVVGAERVTLIVNDGADRSLLPRTFERLLGLPDGLLVPDPSQSNPSLSWAEVELVRATHRAFEDLGVDRRDRDPWAAAGLVRHLQGVDLPRATPTTPPFPDWAAEQVRQIGADRARAVRDSAVRVVGDADALLTREPLAVGPVDVPPALPQAAVAVAVRALVQATVERVPDLRSAPPVEEGRRDG
ncbi:hypothetical protein [Nocardioides sp. YIM 152315]|uniref:hypothetical protein n=1 Tax=Nocardioides sp. YIM 152315 TaxID=3031760 RepID=UPI0023DAAE2D|nr:hypothetical protein [Nocardioides sp. YIM 152315]MDF1606186.1 hypothetical protein [Nocardioides sp. YIM 152315]